jgi:hypothetical protein
MRPHCRSFVSVFPAAAAPPAPAAVVDLNQAFGTRPAHSADQLGPCAKLATGLEQQLWRNAPPRSWSSPRTAEHTRTEHA